MNVEATYSNLSPTIYNELVLFIWSRDGFAKVKDDRAGVVNVTLLAEDKIFYKLHPECQALIAGSVKSVDAEVDAS